MIWVTLKVHKKPIHLIRKKEEEIKKPIHFAIQNVITKNLYIWLKCYQSRLLFTMHLNTQSKLEKKKRKLKKKKNKNKKWQKTYTSDSQHSLPLLQTACFLPYLEGICCVWTTKYAIIATMIRIYMKTLILWTGIQSS